MLRILLLLIASSSLSACYYMQAASGQWEVMRKRVPIDEVIAAPATAPELGRKLSLLVEAREFSVEVLHLPDNKSYRSYADLQRDYVVWNVLAATEFSLQPKQWCFPVAGCVSYRGYFSEPRAVRKSQQLAADGFDVAVGGVAAYSTLGKFNDPVLNTMMHWDDAELLALLFHELAHQVVYVKGDTAFNESFATAVEEFGVQAWLDQKTTGEAFDGFASDENYRHEFSNILDDARGDLRLIYTQKIDAVEMRRQKKLRFDELSIDLRALAEANERPISAWYAGELNNAHLISSAVYEGLLPQFREIYAGCGEDIDCFYAAAKRLAALDKGEREQMLSTGDLLHFSRGTDT